ncbi:MAG: hypothetical protein ACJAS1_003454 [Oleiphilaceae bacterium]|jgi:hypothetical protein
MTNDIKEKLKDMIVVVENMIIKIAYKRVIGGQKYARSESRRLEKSLEKQLAIMHNVPSFIPNFSIYYMLYDSSMRLIKLYAFTHKHYPIKIDKRKSQQSYIHAAEAEYRIVEAKMNKKFGDKISFQFFYKKSDSNILLAKLHYLINVERHRKLNYVFELTHSRL